MTSLIDAQFFYFLFFLASITTLVVQFFLKNLFKPNATMRKHPPSPWALPIIGHLHLLSTNTHKSFHTLALRYGPIMKIRVGASTAYVVSNASVAKDILKTHDLIFSSRPTFGSMEHNIYEGPSLATADYGKYWRFLKKICMEEILSAPRLNQFACIRNEEKLKMMEVIVKCSVNGEACNLGNELMIFTNNIICRMAMSTRCSGSIDESGEIMEFLSGMTEIAGKLALGEILGPLKKFDLLGIGKRLKALMLRYDRLVDRLLTEREKEKKDGGFRERKDMMDILLDNLTDENAEIKLTRDNVKAFLLDLFVGGTETTSKTIQWILAEIINNPDVGRKLRTEINTVVGKGRLVGESDVPNLPYLKAVIKETLRLHPTLPLFRRKCREDCKISGYDIPADSRIVFNVYAIMRDEDSWEMPTTFWPERFLDSQVDMKGHDFNFLPFGSGRRKCVGLGLADIVMHVTVATLVQCFDWKTDEGQKLEMEEGLGMTLGMSRPLVCFPTLLFNPMEGTNGTPTN